MGSMENKHLPLTNSWKRSQDYGIDPLNVNNDLLTGGEIEDRKEGLQDLFQACSPILDQLYIQLKKSMFSIIVADPEGYIVYNRGDSSFMDHAKSVWLDTGANWSENVKGTNAIGTAIIENRSVSVVGDQHFSQENHFLTCYSSPLYSPNGELMGILDVSGVSSQHHPHTLGMVIAASHSCQSQLLLQNTKRELTLAFRENEAISHKLNQPLISIDHDGVIQQINQRAAQILKKPTYQCIGSPLSNWFDDHSIDQLLTSNQANNHFHMKSGSNIWTTETIMDDRQKMFRSILSLEQPKEDQLERSIHTIWKCRKAERVIQYARHVAKTDATMLIQGETGTGKEMIAEEIHRASGREGNLVAINCGAIPDALVESELFGFEKGAFTGANQKGSMGKIKAAHKGTLFLDEIGEMPSSMQSVLLRFLDNKRITPLGSHRPEYVDVRILAATNRNLPRDLNGKSFRDDLYYRLAELTITLPSLRERTDILTLTNHFLDKIHDELNIDDGCLDNHAREKILDYNWPGNIRELHHQIRQATYHAYFMRESTMVTDSDLQFPASQENHDEHFEDRKSVV